MYKSHGRACQQCDMAGLELAALILTISRCVLGIYNMAGLELAALHFNYKQSCIIWNMAGHELAALYSNF